MEEGEELGKEGNNAHIVGLNVTENQQDREDSSRDLKPEHQKGKVIGARVRRAREGSEHCARRLEGNREQAKKRRQQQGARTRASERFNKNVNKRGMKSLA